MVASTIPYIGEVITRRNLLAAALAPKRAAPELAITIDDFNWQTIPEPWGSVANRTLLNALETSGLKTALFVIGSNVEAAEGARLLDAWDRAGHMIGNHTDSHRTLHASTTAEFQEDILRCEAKLKPFPNYRGFFRFPQLKEGNTEAKRDGIRQFLKDHGMRNGHVTVDASDWYYDAQLRSRLKADPAYDISRFRQPYLAHLMDRAVYYNLLAQEATGRNPRHTLLLHYNLINVLFLGDALRMFTEHGWKLISAVDAYRDPVFQSSPVTLPAGESLIWAIAKATGRFDAKLRYPGENDVYEAPKLEGL